MGDGEKDARDEGEGVGKEKTASSSKEEDEKRSSINKLQHDMDGEWDTISRNKELIVFGLGL